MLCEAVKSKLVVFGGGKSFLRNFCVALVAFLSACGWFSLPFLKHPSQRVIDPL
jgi:hypothetical protein